MYSQSHLPVREQKTAEGHAVRAMYMYSAMADLAEACGDDSLMEACRTLWEAHVYHGQHRLIRYPGTVHSGL